MPYNYSKLQGRIVECFGSQSNFSTAIGLSERSLSLKLNGKRGCKQSEIARACKALSIQDNEIGTYFFTM